MGRALDATGREYEPTASSYAQGLKLHAAFKLSFILTVLQKHGLVTPAVAESVTSFIAANQTFGGSSAPAAAPAPAAVPAPPRR